MKRLAWLAVVACFSGCAPVWQGFTTTKLDGEYQHVGDCGGKAHERVYDATAHTVRYRCAGGPFEPVTVRGVTSLETVTVPE